jgi:hypothetical protein
LRSGRPARSWQADRHGGARALATGLLAGTREIAVSISFSISFSSFPFQECLKKGKITSSTFRKKRVSLPPVIFELILKKLRKKSQKKYTPQNNLLPLNVFSLIVTPNKHAFSLYIFLMIQSKKEVYQFFLLNSMPKLKM